MKKNAKGVGLAFCILGAVLAVGLYALFHGYFDRGQFQVTQARWSPSGQVAVVVERSDQEAMSGYIYFVLIGDHVPSPSELRHAYYSSAVVFAAADDCLDLHWQGPTKLVISCGGPGMTREPIEVEKHRSGPIAILYENIPTM